MGKGVNRMEPSTFFWLLVLGLIVWILLSAEDTPKPDPHDEIRQIKDKAYHDAHSLSEEFLQIALYYLTKNRR